MKRFLYGTTALVVTSLVAGGASAASGLKLGITGFYRNSVGGSFGNSPQTQIPSPGGVGATTFGLGNFDRQNASMRQEIRVNFTGQTTLDNGITVGVLVGLNGENVAKSGSTTQINRAYADFSGKFGMVRVGEANSALLTDCVGDPGNVTSNFGLNSPNESYSNVGLTALRNQSAPVPFAAHGTLGVGQVGTIGTCYGVESKGNKLMYFSPAFGGFTFAISFAPQGSSRLAGGLLAPGTNLKQGIANVVSLGADYVRDFGSWKLTLGGGGEWALTNYSTAGGTISDKPAYYQAGLQVGIGRWTVGASGAYAPNYATYYAVANTASPSDNGWVVTAGISQTVDNIALGLEGLYSSWGQFGGAADNETVWGVSATSSYAYGPGISLEAQIAFTQADYGSIGGIPVPLFAGTGVNSSKVNSWELDLGTAINF
jgi:outer membrane protein OmpU